MIVLLSLVIFCVLIRQFLNLKFVRRPGRVRYSVLQKTNNELGRDGNCGLELVITEGNKETLQPPTPTPPIPHLPNPQPMAQSPPVGCKTKIFFFIFSDLFLWRGAPSASSYILKSKI